MGHVLQVDGVDVAGLLSVGPDLSHDALLHSAREHETAVVVGVLTDKVDSSRRCIDITGHSIKVLDETASYEFNFHIVVY